MDRRFRFGVVAKPEYTGAQWRAGARRAEELGYSTLLMPDGLHLLAPLPAAAVAATVTTTLHVGTFVLASTVRPPRTAAWEAHSLATLTDYRFELGIGTGNPWMNQAAVDEIGMSATTPAQRLTLLRRTVEHLRGLETTTRTPVMIAAGGRRSRALALGDVIPRPIVPLVGDDLNALIESDSLLMLRGTPQEMADEIQRRRDEFGYSYITVNALYLETFAPVVEFLHGR